MVGVYKISSPTGKVYIGQSHHIEYRRARYSAMSCPLQPKLLASFKKHGWDNHTFEIIHELPEDISQEILDQYERLYWNQYRESVEMLNLKEPGFGGRHSDDTKKKIGEAMKGKNKVKTEAQRRKGIKFSEEARKRMSEAAKNREK
jgi:group I intron endonuclease